MSNDHRAGNAVILMYHRIADDGTDLCVPPAEFRQHMAWLHQAEYRVLPLRELASALQRGDAPERSIAITFDDGYLDALTQAAPVLQEFGLPATVFVVSSTLDSTGEFWWDTIERVFAHDSLPAALNTALPEGVVSMPTGTPLERQAASAAVRSAFYPLTLEQRDERVDNLRRWSGLPATAGTSSGATFDVRAMTPHEVVALGRLPGLEIGAHTENHLLLPTQPTPAKQREITRCKEQLEALLGYEVYSLAYPYGAFDEESVDLARRAGYTIAVTTGNLPACADSHPLVLPRFGVRAGDDFPSRLQAMFATEPQAHHYNRSFT
ncbi:polysaccharide deacetylase family protein [Xanthomonas sacchari]|uniref:polysaccharide deacetylase family protein n=1 Tax=Xanthomonas sacchari TaxID=56458 RepID=UPI00224C9628|nr:polysaccharide deacetylase family protein [Xanthomonas sacchari]MCW0447194.1 hypothetical protein [Xanthomonas sacchari]MCW0452906.1 hypothetical protein [Xanthomonas sacchari]UYK77840.1 polysaccharide deacetylase family protein [Xanthomonas sacchari]